MRTLKNYTFVTAILVASVFLFAGWIALNGEGNNPSHSNQEHGNNPRTVPETLDLLTYVYLLDTDLYSGYVAMAESPLIECIEGALLLCGAGEVCWICVVNHEVCSFMCRNDDGSCTPAPRCGPDPVPDVDA